MPEVRQAKEPNQLEKLSPEMRTEVEKGLAKDTPDDAPPKEVNVLNVVAQFCSSYPGEFQNGEIGWRLFWCLWAKVDKANSLKRINMTHAMMLGSGMYGDTGNERERDRQRASVLE